MHKQYNDAADKLETRVKYIETQKDLLTPKQQVDLQNSDSLINVFEAEEKQQAIIVKLIKERRQQLLTVASQQLKNSKATLYFDAAERRAVLYSFKKGNLAFKTPA